VKKVLVIVNLYHASPRIPGLCTYLPEFGWEATVLSPPLREGAETHLGFPRAFLKRTRILEAPFRGDIFWFWRKIFQGLGFRINESITEQIKERAGMFKQKSFIDVMMKWYQMIFAYPDTEKTWGKPALKTGRRVLHQEQFDAILSSSPFPTTHIVAAELKKEFGLGWIADFRDPWSQNHNYPYGRRRRYLDKRLELKTLLRADAITAASPLYAKKQEELHQRPTTVITNGFNPEDLNQPPIPLRETFTITYTGTVYPGKQNPEKFLIALEGLLTEKRIERKNVEARFYGQSYSWFKEKILACGLNNVVQLCGFVSRQESVERQRESHLLLLFNWEDEEEKGVYPSKFFEYLSSQRPILATGGFHGADLENLLQETNAGMYATTIEKIRNAIMDTFKEYNETKHVTYYGDLKKINNYSYHSMAEKFAHILDQIVER
jgi:glycosyltransferase involved in cell wall biosynthesis